MKKKFFLTVAIILIAILAIIFVGCKSCNSNKSIKTKETEEVTTENETESDTELSSEDETEDVSKVDEETESEDSSKQTEQTEPYARNTELENLLFDYYKSDVTNVIQYSELKDEYLWFTPEQLSYYDKLCDEWVEKRGVGKTKTSLDLKEYLIRTNNGTYKGIKNTDFVNFSFVGKDITIDELVETIIEQGAYPIKYIDYLYIRIFYNQPDNITDVYIVRAEGDWN